MRVAELVNSDCESRENGGFCGFGGLEDFGKLETLHTPQCHPVGDTEGAQLRVKHHLYNTQ
jgi:hypothetical protein